MNGDRGMAAAHPHARLHRRPSSTAARTVSSSRMDPVSVGSARFSTCKLGEIERIQGKISVSRRNARGPRQTEPLMSSPAVFQSELLLRIAKRRRDSADSMPSQSFWQAGGIGREGAKATVRRTHLAFPHRPARRPPETDGPGDPGAVRHRPSVRVRATRGRPFHIDQYGRPPQPTV